LQCLGGTVVGNLAQMQAGPLTVMECLTLSRKSSRQSEVVEGLLLSLHLPSVVEHRLAGLMAVARIETMHLQYYCGDKNWGSQTSARAELEDEIILEDSLRAREGLKSVGIHQGGTRAVKPRNER